ncbi:NAD-dependent epimerase/dehydratase family protein [Streptomyces sp. NPDC001380]|uniref:NAD-dependent epimerase/dehydratase family protein n=1 Tax=Streptomyces sp. NPDC001380 TaxID=3364566 RepID=UPI0036927382
MRTLIIGGTRFVGRALTEAALAAGHDVTLLHRGRTGPGLFPEAEHLLADRDGDLSVLAGRSWDATVDVTAYRPAQVRALAAALPAARAGRYVLVSSTAVYDAPAAPGFTEDSPLRALAPGASRETVDSGTYGPLKALCEEAARELYGPETLVVRPTYVIGPHDHTDRFTHWVRRIARGGEVLAPGRPEDPVQLVDARDLAAWTVAMAERSGGTFHAVHPAPPFTFGDMLGVIAAEVAPAGTVLTWVGEEFLEAEGVDDTALPLWGGGSPFGTAANTADPAAALRAGFAPRPLAQSVREIHGLVHLAPELPGRLSAGQESELLEKWARTRG